MLVTIESFDIIIGMDWLSLRIAEILCNEKHVWLPFPNNETLIIYRDKSRKSLKIILCIKSHKYLFNKCYAFLARTVDKCCKSKEIKDTICIGFSGYCPIRLTWITSSETS